jgi:hypothetical protein
MGRCDYSVTANGMSEREAYNNAIEYANEYHGHEEGYSGTINSDDGDMKTKCIKKPKPAKRCVVKQNTNKGARKWVTVYNIRPTWKGDGNSATVKTSQADAMKKAKELALKHNCEMEVSIGKELTEGVQRIAEVSPSKSEEGTWKFWGMARC